MKSISIQLTDEEVASIDLLKEKYSIKTNAGMIRYALKVLGGSQDRPEVVISSTVNVNALKAVHITNKTITMSDGDNMVTIGNAPIALRISCTELIKDGDNI